MDVFSMLKKDHKRVAGLLTKLDKTEEEDKNERESLFQQLKTELEAHAALEETIFYPRVEQASEDLEELVREANEEHAVVKRLLEELDSLSKEDEQWGAKLTVLKENVEHHVEEEEGEMFPKARKALEKQQTRALSGEVARAKGTDRVAATAGRTSASRGSSTSTARSKTAQRPKAKTSSKKSAQSKSARRPQASAKTRKAGQKRRTA